MILQNMARNYYNDVDIKRPRTLTEKVLGVSLSIPR